MDKVNQVTRIVTLYNAYAEGLGVDLTNRQLADAFGVSEMTIARDLGILDGLDEAVGQLLDRLEAAAGYGNG